MKTPRLFIAAIFGAVSVGSILSVHDPAAATPPPIVRADPRAGDPDEPGYWKSLPFDEGDANFTYTETDSRSSSTNSSNWLSSTYEHLINLLFRGRR